MAFFVYSSDSIILFIIVTMFHKIVHFFLNVVDAFFYVCKAWGFFAIAYIRARICTL